MKGALGGAGSGGLGVGVSPYPLPAKKRWKGLVIAVLGLVILSMLVPLVFLLGLHNGFHAIGSVTEKHNTVSSALGGYGHHPSNAAGNKSTQDRSRHVDGLMKRLGPTITKEFKSSKERVVNKSSIHTISMQHQPTLGVPRQSSPISASKTPKAKNSTTVGMLSQEKVVQEGKISCELKYGSYCLWRLEYREDMRDSMVKRLKDRLFVARAYYPSIAKLSDQDKLSRELKQNIQDFERVLSESTTDADLPPQMEKKLQKMEVVISKAKSMTVDCNNVDKKLRQLVDLTEDETSFHTRQSAFLYQLAVQTMPKSLHCLSMKLTVEYFRSPPSDMEDTVAQRFSDQTLYHYVIFSDNILASTVAINSTVIHAKESRKMVFHVVTDNQNYYAMKLWFLRNTFKAATVRVLNIEDQSHRFLDSTFSNLSLPEESRVSFQSVKLSNMQHRTEYISLFSHSHYLLPDIFHELDKIILLDDDIVVQQDLSALWSIDMRGKVNAAVEHCDVTLSLLNNHLNRNDFNGRSCAWMSGLNIIDLMKWRELDLSGAFRSFVRELNADGVSDRAVASYASLLTFQDQVHALDGYWALSGLGHDYDLDPSKSAVLHYSGSMKPWLELAIPKYRDYWIKHLNHDDQFLSSCNVIP